MPQPSNISPTPVSIPAPSAPLPGRRRRNTQQRLLEAALEVFAERGIDASSVEEVCERADFSRGAFYSNYASKDDLVLALYDQQVGRFVEAMESAPIPTDDAHPVKGPGALQEAVRAILSALPQDRRWFLINSNLVLHATRAPEVAATLIGQRARLRSGVARVVERTLALVGLELTVAPEEVVRWLLAVHEGGLAQAYLEPEALEATTVAEAVMPLLLAAVSRPAPRPGRS